MPELTTAEIPTLAFEFQPIKLADLRKILPVKGNKYAEIINQIHLHLEQIAPDEAFLVRPNQGQTLTPEETKNFLNAINNHLRAERMAWHAVFSKVTNSIVLAPYKRKIYGYRPAKITKVSPAAEGNGSTAGFTDDSQTRLNKLMELTKQLFGVTVEQLRQKERGESYPELVDIKRAVVYVGRNGMGLKLREIADVLELTSSSTTTLCQQAMTHPTAKEKVALLSEALNNGGSPT